MDDFDIPQEELQRIREQADARYLAEWEQRQAKAESPDSGPEDERPPEATRADVAGSPSTRQSAVSGRQWAELVTPQEHPVGVRQGSYLLSALAFALPWIAYLLLGPDSPERARDRLEQYQTVEFWLRLAGVGAAAYVAVVIFTYSRRLRAPGALAVMRSDRRPPILLLRAFQDDRAEIDNAAPLLDWRRVWGRVGWDRDRSFEEVIGALFGRCGPVVAIGRPGEPVPPLGAARFWIGDDWWQVAVKQLLDSSQRVAMIMGRLDGREGLTWEVRRVFALNRPEKVVLLMPPVGEGEARARWEGYRALSGGRLPEYRGGELAVGFDAAGGCIVVRATRRWGAYGRGEAAYRAAIRVPPPSRLGWVVVGVALAIFGLMKVAGFVLPAVQMTRENAARAQVANNLKHLGSAMHNFDEASPEAFGFEVVSVNDADARRLGLPASTGVEVVRVVPNSRADAADLRPGLVIAKVGGVPTANDPERFGRQWAAGAAGQLDLETLDPEPLRNTDRIVRVCQYLLGAVAGICLLAAYLRLCGPRARTTGCLDFRQPTGPP